MKNLFAKLLQSQSKNAPDASVTVVSCNDFPERVFWREDEADRYIAAQPHSFNGRRVYWHKRTFKVHGEA